jgi:hypothetical protein
VVAKEPARKKQPLEEFLLLRKATVSRPGSKEKPAGISVVGTPSGSTILMTRGRGFGFQLDDAAETVACRRHSATAAGSERRCSSQRTRCHLTELLRRAKVVATDSAHPGVRSNAAARGRTTVETRD